jgi:hypothetical protein
MDDERPSTDWREIINQLRLEAGRIMEDTSGQVAMILPADSDKIAVHLNAVREAADDIQSLLAAAQVLHRRCRGAIDQA